MVFSSRARSRRILQHPIACSSPGLPLSVLEQPRRPTGEFREPSYSVRFSNNISLAEFAPYETCCELLCIALQDRIIISKLEFKECNNLVHDEDDGRLQVLWEIFHNYGHPSCLCWNPSTLSKLTPDSVSLCIGCYDFNLCVFDINLGESDYKRKVLEGHKSDINSIMYHPNGQYLASGSNDFTCRIWSVKNDYACIAVLKFHTFVTCVKFNVFKPDHVIIALKNGKVHLVNVDIQRVIKTFDCEEEPLLMIDWSPTSCNHIAAVIQDELIRWDDSLSSYATRSPVERRSTHLKFGHYVKFAPWSHRIIATLGGPNPEYILRVHVVSGDRDELFSTFVRMRPRNMSWHFRLPLICAGIGDKLCFWEIPGPHGV